MEIRPKGNMVLVRPDPPVLTSLGGLELPEAYVPRPPSGYVLIVGDGRKTETGRTGLPLQPGDHVMFNKNSGWRFRRPAQGRPELVGINEPYSEDDVLLVNAGDVLCTVTETEERPA